jgi:hypothetical protein
MLLTEDSIKKLMAEITLQQQETEGDYYQYDNNPPITATKGFIETFGDVAPALAYAAVKKVIQTYDKPDYLQVMFYSNVKFYLCDHKDYGGVTALMPEEW